MKKSHPPSNVGGGQYLPLDPVHCYWPEWPCVLLTHSLTHLYFFYLLATFLIPSLSNNTQLKEWAPKLGATYSLPFLCIISFDPHL